MDGFDAHRRRAGFHTCLMRQDTESGGYAKPPYGSPSYSVSDVRTADDEYEYDDEDDRTQRLRQAGRLPHSHSWEVGFNARKEAKSLRGCCQALRTADSTSWRTV